jgi:curved DNA-binding protein
MHDQDYYAALGVPENAAPKEIKAAYRRLAFRHHPDRNRGNPAAAEEMKRVNEAYAVLSDPVKRGEYDSLRREYGRTAHDRFRTRHSDQEIFSGSDINSIFEELSRMFGLRGIDDIFRDVYGPAYRGFEFKPCRRSMRTVIFSRPIRSGRPPGAAPPAGGIRGPILRFVIRRLTGIELPVDGRDLSDRILLDPQLALRGGPYAYYHRWRGKKLVVTIPPGVRPGQRIRLAGMGTAGRNGGRPGDLLLQVEWRRPPLKIAADFLRRLFAKIAPPGR